jgi:hypothetical protein
MKLVGPVLLSTAVVATLFYMTQYKYNYVNWYYNIIKFIIINTKDLIKIKINIFNKEVSMIHFIH